MAQPCQSASRVVRWAHGPPPRDMNECFAYVDAVARAAYYPRGSKRPWDAPVPLDGAHGLRLHAGDAPPADAVAGEVFVDTSLNALRGPRTGNAWPIAASTVGRSASHVWRGAGPPDELYASPGDFYIDTAGRALYGPLGEDGVWPAPVELTGEPGGRTVFHGSGAPQDGEPEGVKSGDTYIDTETLTVYGPYDGDGGQWPPGAALRCRFWVGSGAPSPGPADAGAGDVYIDRDAGLMYGPFAGGAWPPDAVLLRGPDGADAEDGPQGATIIAGHGPPVYVARHDDMYIDMDSSTMYSHFEGGRFARAINLAGPPANATLWASYASADVVTISGVKDGDFYLDLRRASLHGPRSGDAWAAEMQLGSRIWAVDDEARDGDLLVDWDAVALRAREGGEWGALLSMRGEAGNPGPEGPAFQTILRYGPGEPDPDEDLDHWVHLNTTTLTFYYAFREGMHLYIWEMSSIAGRLSARLVPTEQFWEDAVLNGDINPGDMVVHPKRQVICTAETYGAPIGSMFSTFRYPDGPPSVIMIDGEKMIIPGETEDDDVVFEVKGPRGDSGARGALLWPFHPGEHAVAGDFYVDRATYSLCGPFDGDAWPEPISLVGEPGHGIHGGPDEPGTDGFVDGDMYLRTTDPPQLYGPFSGGAWPAPLVGLRGAKGEQGDPGRKFTAHPTTLNAGDAAVDVDQRELVVTGSPSRIPLVARLNRRRVWGLTSVPSVERSPFQLREGDYAIVTGGTETNEYGDTIPRARLIGPATALDGVPTLVGAPSVSLVAPPRLRALDYICLSGEGQVDYGEYFQFIVKLDTQLASAGVAGGISFDMPIYLLTLPAGSYIISWSTYAPLTYDTGLRVVLHGTSLRADSSHGYMNTLTQALVVPPGGWNVRLMCIYLGITVSGLFNTCFTAIRIA